MMQIRSFIVPLVTLILAVSSYSTYAEDKAASYTVKKLSLLGPVPHPKGEKGFIVFDVKDAPVIYFDEMPYQNMTMHCDNITSEYYYFPLYPRIYYLPCPTRSLVAKNRNNIIWKFPLDEYEDEPIGFSNKSIILHSYNRAKIDVLSYETGKVLHTVGTDLFMCKEYPRSGYYSETNNILYLYCNEGVLKGLNLDNNELSEVYKPDSVLLSKSAPTMNNLHIDSSGRFLIASQTMPSTLSTSSGIVVFDLEAKKIIYQEKIYNWSWDVDIAVGKKSDFAIAYRCGDDYNDKMCGTYYQIESPAQ